MKHINKIPSYWWDFENGVENIIVESDDDRFPVIARFKVISDNAMPIIDQATKLIEDSKAGRKDPRKLAKLV